MKPEPQKPEMTDEDAMLSWQQSAEKFVEQVIRVDGSDPSHMVISNQQRELLQLVTRMVWAKIDRYDGKAQSPEDAALALKRGISVMAGQGTGKDAASSWIIIWFLFCFPRALVPCTAPTQHQLEQVLWREINKWLRHADGQHERAGSPFRLSQVIRWQAKKVFHVESQGRDTYAVPITVNAKSSAEEQAETLAGLHEEFMVYLVDEASGVPDPVYGPIEGSQTQTCNFAILIFNPTKLRCYAVETHTGKKSEFWAKLRWNAEDSELVTRDQVDQLRKEYGRDSNLYRIRVLGLPPKADPDTLIPWDWIEYAAAEDLDLERHPDDARVMAIDVAGMGKDLTVILTGTVGPGGIVVDMPQTFHGLDTEAVVNWAWGIALDFEPDVVFVDAVGIGFGVASGLSRRANLNVVQIIAQENSTDPRCSNKHDQLWWAMREAFERRMVKIPRHDRLMSQLGTPKIDEPKNGKLVVESNKKCKSRGAGSLDEASALSFFFEMDPRYLAAMRRGNVERSAARKARPVDWRVA